MRTSLPVPSPRVPSLVVVSAVACLASFAAPEAVFGVVVDTTEDSGEGSCPIFDSLSPGCSLREAICVANGESDFSTGCDDTVLSVIEFFLPDDSTIKLLDTLPTLNSGVTIDGSSVGDGSDSDDYGLVVAPGFDGRIFTVDLPCGDQLTVKNLTLGGGFVDLPTSYAAGGAVSVLGYGDTTFEEVRFVHNTVRGELAFGGAVFVNQAIECGESPELLQPRVVFDRCELRDNVALGSEYVSDSPPFAFGGAVGVYSGNLEVRDSLFVGNVASGGLDSAGVGGDGRGGAIHYRAPFESALAPLLEITNSTISGNSALSDPETGSAMGGGVYTLDESSAIAVMTIEYTTVTENVVDGSSAAGAGLWGGAELSGVIVAGNSGAFDVHGPVDSGADPNLIGPDIDPLLGPLADNGGPTMTHRLLSESPALDAGSVGPASGVDQRGEDRGTLPDLGAFEAVAFIDSIADLDLGFGSSVSISFGAGDETVTPVLGSKPFEIECVSTSDASVIDCDDLSVTTGDAEGDNTFELTVSHDLSSSSGESVVTMGVVHGSESVNTSFLVSVSPPPDFAVTIEGPDLAIPQGGSGERDVRVDRIEGWEGDVTLSCAGLPPGVGCSFDPEVVADDGMASQRSRLVVTVAPDAEPGPLTVRVEGSGTVLGSEEIRGDQVGLEVLAALFADGFESGTTDAWSSSSP